MPRSAKNSYVPPTRGVAPRPLHAVEGPGPCAERSRQRDYFMMYLRATTNRYGRPYAERAIAAQDDALISLEKWLVKVGFDGDFCAVDTPTLNAYFRDYIAANSQGGANTKQRKLSLFFRWLSEEYETPSPYTPKLHRYSPPNPEDHVAVLDPALIKALLRVTSGKDFAAVRDHALIRLFLTGIRRDQMAHLRVQDVDLRDRVITVIGQKGSSDGHQVPFGHKAALAIARWLRVRAGNRTVTAEDEGPLWVGTRNRGRMRGDGLMVMLKRRAVEAGYQASDIYPHMFRHTFAHEFLDDGGSEGDLMRHHNWRDRTMVDRYAASHARQRAVKDVHRRALDDRY